MHRTVQQREAATVAANALDDFRDSTDLAKTVLELAKAGPGQLAGLTVSSVTLAALRSAFVRPFGCRRVSSWLA